MAYRGQKNSQTLYFIKYTFTNRLVLTTFILKVYAPMWFAIKTQHSCTNGARHLHQTMLKSRYLSMPNRVFPSDSRNGFLGHPENLLIAMLANERDGVFFFFFINFWQFFDFLQFLSVLGQYKKFEYKDKFYIFVIAL